MQPRSLGEKKSQNKGLGESSTSSLIMKEAWAERGGRAQRSDRRAWDVANSRVSEGHRLWKEPRSGKVLPLHTGAGS